MLDKDKTGLIGKRIDDDIKWAQYAPFVVVIIALVAFLLLISGCAIDRTGKLMPSEIVDNRINESMVVKSELKIEQ